MTGDLFEIIGIIVVSAVVYIILTGGFAGIIVGDLDETPMLAWLLGCVITVCLVLLWIFVPCPLVLK